ncbi:hypothetical protein SBRY_60442 [Actinacidiphila bryophytorum]|uniref:Secreted protein n=1 Tax=Actinacidiphila bryophytorum TaxID=1436133 RepID=A0A9W4MJF6_9ACTN|nr:hypothetical protein SBRY_60442 [Actinacidiphila bryophytorum]
MTVMPVCFLNWAAAFFSAATWDCLKVHIVSDLASPDPEEPPPQAASGVSDRTVATVTAANLVFGVKRANGVRMGPYLGFGRSEDRMTLE